MILFREAINKDVNNTNNLFLTLTFSASFCESIIFLKLFEKIEWLLRNFNWFKVVEIFIFIHSVNNEVLVVFQHTSNLIKSWPSIWIIFPTACNKIAIIVYEIVTSEEIFPTFTNYIQIHNATIYYYGKWINITGNRKFVFQSIDLSCYFHLYAFALISPNQLFWGINNRLQV